MTSLRELKKDINYLASEFIGDCYLTLHLFPKSDEAEIDALADEIVDSRNNLVHLIHHPEGKHERFINKDITAEKKRKKEHKEKINVAFDEFIKLLDKGYETLKKYSK